MDIILILILILVNGLLAMSELAVAASRRALLLIRKENGDAGAAAALELIARPTQFLSTIQVGMSFIGMLIGIIADAAFGAGLADWLMHLGMGPNLAAVLATTLVVILVTYPTIVLGELVPKRIGQSHPELVARWIARPMIWLSRLVRPFVWLLATSTHAILRLLKINAAQSRTLTEEEISASLKESVDAGLIEAHEHLMVRNVFHLDDRSLTSLMLPREEIIWLDAKHTVKQALAYITSLTHAQSHSWYPVCKNNLDHVIGIISIDILLRLGIESQKILEHHVIAATYIPETLSGMELLEQLRTKTGRLALIVDEYGDVQGLMTPHDLLEAITGELKPELLNDAWATPLSAGRWLLDGTMPINELKSRLKINQLPQEKRGRYHTLAGLVMTLAGHLPTVGENIECNGWIFTVYKFEGRRIDQVIARQASPAAE